jgi:3-phenylpropionate/cinnamic acid dioxygenase small subunit
MRDTVNQDLLRRLEVEDFLIREAELLDQKSYVEWLDLLTEDVNYWAPAVESVEEHRQTYNRIGSPSGMAYFQDTKMTLRQRIDRLGVGGAWAEIPPSRTCHYITNIFIEKDSGYELTVKSKFFVFRSRLEAEEDTYYGSRTDVLRSAEGQLKLADRKIVLAQAVLRSRSISTFF